MREEEEKREVGKILTMCKEAVRKEVEEVKNKYEEMVSEKDRRINELQRELEEEINGRRKEYEEIRMEIVEQRKLMKSLHMQKEKMKEDMNRKIENERKKTDTDSKNWRKVEEIVRFERRRTIDEVGRIWLEIEGIKEEREMEKIQNEKEGKEKEEHEKAKQEQLEELRKERSKDLDDFVRKDEWMESKGKMWEQHLIVRRSLCVLCELWQPGLVKTLELWKPG